MRRRSHYTPPRHKVTGRAIAETSPSHWPLERLAALEHFLITVLKSLLQQEDTGGEIDSWMCAISRMSFNVEPFLAVIETSPRHVVDYYEHNSTSIIKNKLANLFWETPSAGHDRILEWFQCPGVSTIIRTAYGL
jgi:hypothetical protein